MALDRGERRRILNHLVSHQNLKNVWRDRRHITLVDGRLAALFFKGIQYFGGQIKKKTEMAYPTQIRLNFYLRTSMFSL